MVFNPRDYYNKKAKHSGYLARSVYKLDEMQKRFHLITSHTLRVLDLWCSPWSWLQYVRDTIKSPDLCVIGFDLKPVTLTMKGVFPYVCDFTQRDKVLPFFWLHQSSSFDLILSDAAPNTSGIKDLDAMKSIQLIEDSLRIYKDYLKPSWKFAIKVFMWPGFDELVNSLKLIYWGKNIRIFKPDASRAQSKEVYIVKHS